MINLKNILKKTSNKKTKVKTKKVVKKKTKLAKIKKLLFYLNHLIDSKNS